MSPSANSLWTCRSMRWLSLPFPVDELTNINWGNGYIEATHQTGRWNFISNILYVSVSGISTVNWMLILDIHPNYASILLEKQGQKAFSRVITLIPGQELCQRKSTLPTGLCITRFSPRDNEPWRLSSIYFHFVTLGEYISLKKTAEGDRKFSFNVIIYLF